MPFSKDPASYLNNCPNRAVYAFHLFGEGIEIGALAWPLSLPDGVLCRNVDVYSTEELRQTYPEFKDLIVPVEVMDDGQNLTKFSTCSLDFIIANHVLEHVVNVIRTIKRWYDVLKDDGILFLSVPDRRFTADQIRERTPLSHLLYEFENHVSEISEDHCIDNLIAWNGIPREKISAEMIAHCRKIGVHNHCWECEDILQLFQVLFSKKVMRYELLDLSLPKGLFNEFILVLRKSPEAANFWTEFARKKYVEQEEKEGRILWLMKNQKT
jgi:SAM-dependent methyltransferase